MIISIPSIARRNVELAYEPSPAFDPSVADMLASIHKKHKQPRAKKHRPAKKIYKQPEPQIVIPSKPAPPAVMTVTVPRVRIITVVDKHSGWSRIITHRTEVIQIVPNRLTPQNALRLMGHIVDYQNRTGPYIAEQTKAFDLRTRQTFPKPDFPIPVTHWVISHKSAQHAQWEALPVALRQAALEPPKYITTESDFDLPSRSFNPDIPDNLAFDVMGCNDRVNEHLDARAMDDRHFRESCVQIGTGIERKNLFLEPKHGSSRHLVYPLERVQPEIGPPSPFAPYKTTIRGRFTRAQTFMSPDWLAERLHCSLELAIELKEAFKKLEINSWQLASRIIYGKTCSGQIVCAFKVIKTKLKGVKVKSAFGKTPKGEIEQCAKGLISYIPKVGPPDMRGLEAAVHYLTELASGVEEVTVEWPRMANWDLRDEYFEPEFDEFWLNADLGPDETPFIEDELDVYGGDFNPYTGHALFGDGTEALAMPYVDAIRTASDFSLSAAAQKMRPHMMEITPPVWKIRDDICIIDKDTDYWLNRIVAGTYRPKKEAPIKQFLVLVTPGTYRQPNCGMTADQTAHFWGLWHDQRAAISEALEHTTEFKRYERNLSLIAARNRAATYLFALKNGTEFRIGRDIIHHAGVKVIPTALKKLWAQFNERFPKDEAPVAAAAGMDIPW